MWGSKQRKTTRIDSLIGRNSCMTGDIDFTGGLHIDGKVIGNVTAKQDPNAVVTISEHGVIEGEIHVPYVIVDGRVAGDVHANKQVELASQARIEGNVYYHLIEMVRGAEVNGSLVHTENEALAPTNNLDNQASQPEQVEEGLIKT